MLDVPLQQAERRIVDAGMQMRAGRAGEAARRSPAAADVSRVVRCRMLDGSERRRPAGGQQGPAGCIANSLAPIACMFATAPCQPARVFVAPFGDR